MYGLNLGRLGIVGGKTWNERTALWPLGTEPGLWIDPSTTTSSYQDSAGTTPISAIGTLADSSNPIGLHLDRKWGATALANPGLHLSQATSAARPFASGRVNLLTKTEDFADAQYVKAGATVAVNASYGPIGIADCWKITEDSAVSQHRFYIERFDGVIGSLYTFSIYAKKDERSWVYVYVGAQGWAYFDIDAGVVGSKSAGTIASMEDAGNGWYRCSVTKDVDAANTYAIFNIVDSDQGVSAPSYDGDGTSGVFIQAAQYAFATQTSAYQRVNTDADYTAAGFPIYDKFDAVDDALLSATVAAGVVGNSNMDCLIAVRRDSAANVVAGLYNAVADATKYFGMAESAAGTACVGAGAGTPTVWVDGVQLAGGTAVTRGTLHTALTVGTFHILEFRGLDLSTWTAAGYGLYTGYVLNGAFGGKGIEVFPATTAADRNKARTRLAASVGLVL